MYRNRLALAVLVSTALGSGCSPGSPAAPEADAWLGPSLLVRAPVLTPSDLIRTEKDTLPPSETMPGEPGGMEGLAPADFEEDPYSRPPAAIFEADSRGDFQEGFGGVYGTQMYGGNKGSITTTAHVSYKDQHVGTATGSREQYTPFLGDWGRTKHLWVFPKVYTDRECGLSVQGGSQHAAWWEFYQGGAVQTWGRDGLSTQAPPYPQGACSNNVGSFEAENAKPGGLVCTYWITYDLDTGEVISAELLYCSSSSGEVM